MTLFARALMLLVLLGAAGNAQASWFGLPFGGASDGVSSSAPEAKAVKRNPAGTGTESKTARVMWLDKQTNRRQTVVLQAGSTQSLNGLNVTLNRCLADYDNTLLQDVAWLEVTEKDRGSPWFAGWMFNTFPEIATLEHPRYDLQLIGCGDKPRAKPSNAKAVVPTVTVTGGEDSEAPGNDSEAPGGDKDPYYVPGVGGDSEAPPAGDSVLAAPAAVAPESALPVEAPAAPTPVAQPPAVQPPVAETTPVAPATPELKPMENQPADDTQELKRMMENGGTY